MHRSSLRGDNATAEEMAALLAELKDVGGDESGSGGGAAAAAGQRQRRGSNNSKSADAAAVTEAEGFSTYNTLFTGDTTENHNTAPLNVRLAPLGAAGTKGAGNKTGARASLPGIPGAPKPLPDLPGGGAEASKGAAPLQPHEPRDGAAPPPRRQFSFRNGYAEFIKKEQEEEEERRRKQREEEEEKEKEKGAGAAGNSSNSNNNAAAVSSVPPGEREANFLPVMCARHLRPAGIAPGGRWGHTLTAVTPTQLLLFGGMDAAGRESDAFVQLDATTLAWDPVFVARGQVPQARHGHAAVAYESRYLIVCGGAARGGATLLGDIHLYDTHLQEWSCLWAGGHRVGGKNEPAPRVGHSAVVREDRLYIFGGRVAKGGDGADVNVSNNSNSNNTEKGGVLATTLANTDIYVFSLSTLRWRRRIRGPKKASDGGGGTAAPRRRSSAAAAVADKQPSEKPHPPPAAAATNGDRKEDDANAATAAAVPAAPAPRAYHAACVKGDFFFINGGSGAHGETLTDTWVINLVTAAGSNKADGANNNNNNSSEWHCLHYGGTADAVPREKHHMFACGEALLLVGGCGASAFNERVAGKFNNFAAVLPILTAETAPAAGSNKAAADAAATTATTATTTTTTTTTTTSVQAAAACWIPVAMGNVAMLAPGRRSFGAAFLGGFVYVFGGVSGSEAATSTLVRFLAADGYVTGDARATRATGDQALRTVMQHARERSVVPPDMYAVLGTLSGDGEGVAELPPSAVGFHRALLQQRAPLLWETLQACRTEPLLARGTGVVAAGGGGGGSSAGKSIRPSSAASSASSKAAGGKGGSGVADGGADEDEEAAAAAAPVVDEVDIFLSQADNKSNNNNNNNNKDNANTSKHGNNAAGGGAIATLYYTTGNSRVKGLPPAVTGEELTCLSEYVYYGGLRAEFKLLLEEAEDKKAAASGKKDNGNDDDDDDNNNNNTDGGAGGNKTSTTVAKQRQRLTETLQVLKDVAGQFKLDPLTHLCEALLAGSRRQLARAREESAAQLREDLLAMLRSGAGATMTVLFVDPHTKQQTTHSLHPVVLAAASPFFADLLRPLYTGERSDFSLGGVAAKTAVGVPLSGSTARRALIVGPVPVPTPAVQPVLRYLYTQALAAAREVAFETMLGSRCLAAAPLQAFCEAVVAREEVTYTSCCSFYYLARRHHAPLLEEMALLTAVSGFGEVSRTDGYASLAPEDKKRIKDVVDELGSASWVPPPQTAAELKPKEVYKSRLENAA